MTRHILILSGNLPGLITAYRLIPYGFRITILDHQQEFYPDASGYSFSESSFPKPSVSPPNQQGQRTPLILHGFYYLTRFLFQELNFQQSFLPSQLVDLEFGTPGGKTIALPKARRLSTLHPVMRLAFFRGLTWTDRWHLINFLEKKWEGRIPPDPNSDTLSVESWLVSIRQTTRAMKEVWNPLCRFFLGCDATHASLGYFWEVLSSFCLSKSNGLETFLASPDMREHLQQKLRRVLSEKRVDFYTTKEPITIQAGTDGIQHISLANKERLSADAYVSSLPPSELLRLLPERAPARFSCFSHLSQLQEATGTAVQFIFTGISLPSRLILNSGIFDWIASQTVSDVQGPKAFITCVSLHSYDAQSHTDQWLFDTTLTHIQHLFNFSLTLTPMSQNPTVIQSSYAFFPCQAGGRTFRPIASTPIFNLFLTGPWTATALPPCLESTVISAYACARTLAEFVHTPSH